MSSPSKEHFYIGSILRSLFHLIVSALLTGLGIKLIPREPKVGWACTLLFGAMFVLSIIELVRQCGLDKDQAPDIKSQLNIRRAIVPIGVTLVTIILGLAENIIALLFTDSFARPGIWCGTFVTTLAFYPLREQKDLNFKLWIIFCALMGVASVFLSYLKDWFEHVLT